MKVIEIGIRIGISNVLELDEADSSLLQAAQQASKAAYAPYSNFHVGAAIRLQNGTIVIGNNQENAAYPSGLCAERTALFAAAAAYPDQAIVCMAVFSNGGSSVASEKPVAPCGACRQVITEYQERHNSKIKILMQYADSKVYISDNAADLLPFGFTQGMLQR